MGLTASSVIPLLSKWEEYLSTNADGDIDGFAHWVLAAAPQSPAAAAPAPRSSAAATPPLASARSVPATSSPDPATSNPDHGTSNPDPGTSDPAAAAIRAPFLITHLYRDLQQRSKPIAKKLGLTNSLELDMLVHIATLKDPNKKQVCQEMLIESSTGVEIAKRLVAKGFIEEKADSKDRRAARLSLTVKGQQTVLQGYTQLAPIHSDILNTLRTQVPPLS